MTDIVERLRNQSNASWNDLHDEAADEIERLRDALKRIAELALTRGPFLNTAMGNIANAALEGK